MENINGFNSDNLKFIDLTWEGYNDLKFDIEAKRKQESYLFYTGLAETSDGVEYTFVPTKRMLLLENELNKLYNSIKIEDTEVALCNEIFYTSKIEGAKTSLVVTQEIHDGNKYPEGFSENMVASGFKATKYLNLIGNKLDVDIMLKVWNILVEDACQNNGIRGERFRTGQVQVGNHVGLNYLLLEEAMQNWVDYYNGEQLSGHPWIKAILLHFAFEFIHPFCDGNGRLGRLLMNNFLIGHGFEKCKVVSFSRSIEKRRLDYDYVLNQSDNVYTDCTPFIHFMLTQMIDAFEDCLAGRLTIV